MTGTGVVALAGIVVNNAIVLIDTYNRLRSEGTPIRDAVLKTSAQRLRPIMLTTVTTIMGLIPMALTVNLNFFAQTITVGSITAVWWVQLSTAIISGLGFSTILTLIMIPSMLTVPENIRSAYAAVTGFASGRNSPATDKKTIEEPKEFAQKIPPKKKVPVRTVASKKASGKKPKTLPDAAE